mmetsp:Transcript_116599/g.267636  ORF Transcript_116599/g.267636 Transcript_116599/m.267636 type:complete len:184 (+) Transcript_116599:598-1149(+)
MVWTWVMGCYREQSIYEKAICLGVVSKAQGLAGLRIGWVASKDAELLEKMASTKLYTSICSAGPSEMLAAITMRSGQPLIEANCQIIKENVKHFEKFVREVPHLFSWHAPQAGSIALVKLLTDEPAKAFCHRTVTEAGVGLLPSEYFEFGDKYLRIGLGRRNFKECLDVLRDYVTKAKKRSTA